MLCVCSYALMIYLFLSLASISLPFPPHRVKTNLAKQINHSKCRQFHSFVHKSQLCIWKTFAQIVGEPQSPHAETTKMPTRHTHTHTHTLWQSVKQRQLHYVGKSLCCLVPLHRSPCSTLPPFAFRLKLVKLFTVNLRGRCQHEPNAIAVKLLPSGFEYPVK